MIGKKQPFKIHLPYLAPFPLLILQGLNPKNVRAARWQLVVATSLDNIITFESLITYSGMYVLVLSLLVVSKVSNAGFEKASSKSPTSLVKYQSEE